MRFLKIAGFVLLLVLAALGGYLYWQHSNAQRLPDGISAGNGRLEARQVQIATKWAGRVAEVLVDEGDLVVDGQIVARMDATEVQAALRGAEAQLAGANHALAEAKAVIAQRESELLLAQQEYERAEALNKKGYGTQEVLDQRRSALDAGRAALEAAKAAQYQAASDIAAAQAEVERLRSQVSDMVLLAPRGGRIQYRVADPGEVLAAGAPVLTLLDLTDVTMTLFLPAGDVGRLRIGSEARLILDAVPQYVVPATVSFIAGEAQFTPNSVETKDERDKLMFRIKLRIDPALLREYEPQVKTGVRGMGYVRVAPDAVWPDWLSVKLPQ